MRLAPLRPLEPRPPHVQDQKHSQGPRQAMCRFCELGAQSRGFHPGALRLPPWGARSAGRRPKVSSSAAQHRAHSPCSGDRAMPWARRGRPAGLGRRWQRWAARAQQAWQRGAVPHCSQPGPDPARLRPPPALSGSRRCSSGQGREPGVPRAQSSGARAPGSPARPGEESRLRRAGARERRASSVSALPGRGDQEPRSRQLGAGRAAACTQVSPAGRPPTRPDAAT